MCVAATARRLELYNAYILRASGRILDLLLRVAFSPHRVREHGKCPVGLAQDTGQ